MMIKLSADEDRRMRAAIAEYVPATPIIKLAEKHDVSMAGLTLRLRKLGVYKTCHDKPRRPISVEESVKLAAAIKEFDPAKNSINAIAKKHGVSYNRLYAELLRLNLHKKWSATTIAATVRTQQANATEKPMSNVKPHPADITANLTTIMKRTIKGELDLHFDAEKGRYADGYSDQEIGRRIDCPWAAVAKIREDFFGPLLGDPVIEAVRVEIEALKFKIQSFEQTDFDGWLGELNVKIAEVDKWHEDYVKWRRELGQWRDQVATERQSVLDKVVQLKNEANRVADQLVKVERRFG